MIKKIIVGNDLLNGICLWNNNFLFVGCKDSTIKLVSLKKGKIIKDLNGHNNSVLTLKKINHPKYGECLLSQGKENDQIKIWINFI